jgi:hypothetical protein
MTLLKVLSAVCFLLFLLPRHVYAVVTYANCPTLNPLPVTNFLPTAMAPIKIVSNSFEVGMNVTIKSAVATASAIQTQATSSSFNSIMVDMIETSHAYNTDLLQIDKQFKDLMMAYESDLAARQSELDGMMFPGDDSMMQPKPGETRSIDPASPSYKFIKEVCSAGKMQQLMTSKKVVKNAFRNKNRRSQKILSNMQVVSGIQAKAKENIDRHYDIFCSQTDFENGLCDQSSMTPNADLDAGLFLYPTGHIASGGRNQDYSTAYTYSAVESLASYQYIKNLTGTLYIPPPTQQELKNSDSAVFVSAYKQMLSVMSLSTDALLHISSMREPINNSGLIMGKLDAMNYLIEKSKLPEYQRVFKSASDNGKMLEMQKHLALQQRLRFAMMEQQDRLRQIKAARLAVEATRAALSEG